jgi:hypothetical protein
MFPERRFDFGWFRVEHYAGILEQPVVDPPGIFHVERFAIHCG